MAHTTDVVVQKYIEMRDEVSRIEHEASERVMALKTKMQTLEAWLTLKLEQDGEESKKTQFGTVFLTTVDFAQVADWSALLEYIIGNEAWDCLEKRVAKTAVRAIIDETNVVPPGVNYGIKRVINVRKPTKT